MVSAALATVTITVTTKIPQRVWINQSPYPLFDSVIFIIEYNKFVKMVNKDS